MTADKHTRAVRPGHRLVAAVFAVVVASSVVAAASATPAFGSQVPSSRPAPGTAWVIFGVDTVRAEVASLPAEREQGLMNRERVPDGTGMLFVFPESEQRSFWMRDTRVALDIAFFDDRYRITAVKQMEPMDETLTDSDQPTALVLEVRQGWFAERGIVAGAQARVVFGPGLEVR